MDTLVRRSDGETRPESAGAAGAEANPGSPGDGKHDESRTGSGIRLNLGSGGKKLPGHINVDCTASEEPDLVWDLERVRWPWEDSSVDSVEAWHVLEHIGEGFFFFLKELYRVCKPGTRIGIIVPHPRHDVFLNDPTHKRVVTPDGMAMFSRKHCEDMERKGGRLTPFWQYLDVNFDLEGPIQMILDPSVNKTDDWKTMERRMNNVVIEYRFAMRVVK